LGVDYKEVVADVTVPPMGRPTDKKYICIAPQSTSQAKYWNNPDGWQKLVDHFNNSGYEVFYVSKENPNDPAYSSRINGLRGFVDRSGLDLNIVLNDIKHCEVFIGLGSGLSWAAWALKKPVVLISGFSDPSIEFSTNCERIINKNVCHGCWSRKYFDKGDWMWCPDNKNTERQFECTKSISSDTVIAAVERQISKNNKFTYIDGNQDFFTARIGG
jgi:autotransporter strand-loop-strand O-heptosyltransferase